MQGDKASYKRNNKTLIVNIIHNNS